MRGNRVPFIYRMQVVYAIVAIEIRQRANASFHFIYDSEACLNGMFCLKYSSLVQINFKQNGLMSHDLLYPDMNSIKQIRTHTHLEAREYLHE